MMLAVDPRSTAPAYEQLRDQVLRLAVAGLLSPGQRLPTIRQLAIDLSLAKGTVERAYELLEREGIVLRRGAAGSFINETLPASSTHVAHDALRDEAHRFALAARQLGMTDEDVLAVVRTALQGIPDD